MNQARRDSWTVQHNPFILAAGFNGLFIARIGPLGNWLWGRYIFTACKVGPVTMEILGTHMVTKLHRIPQKDANTKRTEIVICYCYFMPLESCLEDISILWTNRTDTRYPQPEFLCASSPAPLSLTFSFPFLCSSHLPLHCEQSLLGLFFL